jgi:hypothetical protein
MPHRRHRALYAAAVALAALAACAESDRVVFGALVGEAPGDKPLYTGLSPSARFGRPAPRIGEPLYRPPALPDAQAGAAGDRAREARQALSDRASDYEIRARYLRLNAEEYQTAAGPLRPTVGQPLPADNATTRARLAATRQAMARVQGDVVSLHGIVLRGEQVKAQAERALASVQGRGAAAAPLAQPLRLGIASMDKMLKDGDALVASYVEWLAGERTALDVLEDEIRRGAAAGSPLLQRQSIIQ